MIDDEMKMESLTCVPNRLRVVGPRGDVLLCDLIFAESIPYELSSLQECDVVVGSERIQMC
jgi:hypothetical protein